MSVLICGMDEIPEDGAVLMAKHDDNGKVYIKYAGVMGYSMELEMIPESHGDLIDRDALIELFPDCFKSLQTSVLFVRTAIQTVPTFIEAEGVEE